jgi:hypothetical protein
MIGSATDIVRALAASLMQEEVRQMAGPRYSRHKPHGGRYVRWGSNPGSLHLGAEREHRHAQRDHAPKRRRPKRRQPHRECES